MADWVDVAILALFAVGVTLWEYFIGWPRLQRAVDAGIPRARIRGYQLTMGIEWLAVLVVVVRWVTMGRSWRDLWLVIPTGWRVIVPVVLVAVVAALLLAQGRKVSRLSAKQRARVRGQLGAVDTLLPRTAQELRWFVLVALTAGVCEEVLYRGFAVWALERWLGLWLAAAVSVVLFGFGHAYQGRSGAVKATLTGAVIGGLALLVRSIVPGMVLHALVDVGGGATGYALFGENGERADPKLAVSAPTRVPTP